MRTIYKYAIEPNSVRDMPFPIEIDAPLGAIPRFVGLQNGQPQLWAEVDTSASPARQVVLLCVGTGFGAVPAGTKYFQSLIHGQYVWHFYLPGYPGLDHPDGARRHG